MNWSEVVGSYVDWVQQTGAEAALLPFDMPWEVLTQALSLTNGMVLPGGAAELVDFKNASATTDYQNRIHAILTWVKKQNDSGKYYPVWGTCLGFEEMAISFGGNTGKVLQDGFDDKARYHEVTLKPAFWASDFFGKLSVSKQMIKEVFDRPIAYYYHSEGLGTAHYKELGLSKHLTMIGHSTSDSKKEFVAMLEAKSYPMYFVQFHPEKHQFEKRESYKPMDRSQTTIKVMSSFIFKLVELARKNAKPLDQVPSAIQSFFPYYKQPIWSPSKAFERIYMFKNYYGLPKEKPAKTKLMRLLTTLRKNVGSANKVLGK